MGSSLMQASQEGWNLLVLHTNTLVFFTAEIRKVVNNFHFQSLEF